MPTNPTALERAEALAAQMPAPLTFDLRAADLARVLELALERLDRYAAAVADMAADPQLLSADHAAYQRVRDEYLTTTLAL